MLEEHRKRFMEMERKGVRAADWTVVRVEHTDRQEPVYCAVVPDGQAFTLEHNILTGNCKGADEDFHYLVREMLPDHVIKGHPPYYRTHRAYCEVDELAGEKPYLDRNRDMVDESRLVIATPVGDQEQLRSGTGATIRYARKMDRELIVIGPDGDYIETR